MRIGYPSVILCACVLMLLRSVLYGDGIVVWTPDTGKVDIQKLPRDNPLQQFAYARALAGAGQYADAIRELEKIIKRYPDEVFVEQAEQAIIVCLWQRGKYKDAYRRCWQFLSKYPTSVLVPDVEKMRMQIVVDMSYSNPSGARQLLLELLETSKLEEQSADSLRYIGDSYYREKEYQDARDRYLELIEDYPKSRWVTYAHFRMGLCDYKQGFRQMRDLGLIRRAMSQFKDYLAEYASGPTVVKRGTVEKYLARLEKFDAEHYLEVAEFYERRRDKPDAAAIYLQRLITLYPNSVPAQEAARKLRRLKRKYVLRPEQFVREVPF